MGVGQLSESDAVDALRLPFYSSSHPTGSHGWRNQFDLGNPDLWERKLRKHQKRYEIPVPTREEFEKNLDKVAKPVKPSTARRPKK